MYSDVIYFILPRRCFGVDLCLEEKYEMIARMDSIRILCRITCDYLLYLLRASGSELSCDLVFELGFSVGMMMRATVGSPIEDTIRVLIGFTLGN